MHRETAHRSRRSRSLVVLLLAMAIVAVSGIAAQQASAFSSYEHGTTNGSCTSCHTVNTSTPPTNADCITCHTGYVTLVSGKTCWTCHNPGQDMSAVGPGAPASCTAACHLKDAPTVTVAGTPHNPHATRGVCTTCHTVSQSPTNANGSPHHTLTAPATTTITSFAPTSAPVGTVVTLTGTGFTGATAVAFNGTTTAIFVVVSATQITAEVPSGATTGTIAVTTPGGTGTSATSFTVTVPAVTTKVTLKVAPTSIRFRRTVKATGAVTPVLALVGSKVALKAQIKKGTRWVTTKSVTATVKASGAYSWTYKPAKRGTYRMQASIKATATKRASHSPWRTFKVR